MQSFLSHLECTWCARTLTADEPARTCPDCGKVLFARYDLDEAARRVDRSELQRRAPSLWRYFELLPVRDEANVVSLGEGLTPILEARRLGQRVGSNALYIKDEGTNPTASFKARGLSAAVSRARELGLTALTMPSAGNAGGALAAYAAAAGMEAHVFMPRDAPEANRKEVVAGGAHLTLVDGLIGEAGAQSAEAAAAQDLFDVSTLKEPYRVEGKKTMGYEIAEQMGWALPDAIIYPTGGGTGIVGIWKAFDEMERIGWIGSERPRMFAVQAEHCAPIVRAFHQGAEFAQPWADARTVAAGLRVPSAIGDYLVLRVLRESGGGGVTVTDGEMLDYVKVIASLEGTFVCPEGAATAVGTEKLLAEGALAPDDRVVLLNTASGLKYLDVVDL